MENLKTDGYYNDDDFVQEADNFRELTVEITLCEYRNLIRDLVTQDSAIKNLETEKVNLAKRVDELQKCLAAIKMPEWIETIRGILTGSDNADAESDEESEESATSIERLKERVGE